jgi:hypothetical protein
MLLSGWRRRDWPTRDSGTGPVRRQGEHIQQTTMLNVEIVALVFNGQVEFALEGAQYRYEVRGPAHLPADQQLDFA